MLHLQILLDSSGVLKYADFGLSKAEGENLEELFYKFAEAGEMWNIQSVEEMMKQVSATGKLNVNIMKYLYILLKSLF